MSSDETTSSSLGDLEEYTSSWAQSGFDLEAISENEQLVIQKNNTLQSDIPVFENLRDIPGLTQSNDVKKSVPNVFGYLEIPSINLQQYVVSGTDEMSLQFGPGHYMQTNLPSSGSLLVDIVAILFNILSSTVIAISSRYFITFSTALLMPSLIFLALGFSIL